MPANVESMFSVREMPWHREGLVLDQHPKTWDEARQLAGLTWDPITEPVYELRGVDEAGQPLYEPIKGWQRIAHSETSATLWINRESYAVIDHGEMGALVDRACASSRDRPTGMRMPRVGVDDRADTGSVII
ncbi:hypothetical protein AB0J44_46350, partial [Streptomyces canus]